MRCYYKYIIDTPIGGALRLNLIPLNQNLEEINGRNAVLNYVRILSIAWHDELDKTDIKVIFLQK